MTAAAVTNKPYTPAVGDRVMFADGCARPQDIGVVFTVTQRLRTNVEVTPDSGGRPGRCHPSVLVPAPDIGRPVAPVQTVSYGPPLNLGRVVKVKGRPGLFVVIHENPERCDLAPLGGDPQGRYWHDVGRRHIVPVTVTNIETTDA